MSRARYVGCVVCSFLAAGLFCGFVIVQAAESAAWQSPAVSTPPGAYAAQANAAATATKPAAATKSFKSTLNAAASQAYKEGTITRWQLARVRMAIAFRADAMAEAQACCLDQAVNDGLMRSPADADLDGFDWTQLLAFIKELLPLILQIISILG